MFRIGCENARLSSRLGRCEVLVVYRSGRMSYCVLSEVGFVCEVSFCCEWTIGAVPVLEPGYFFDLFYVMVRHVFFSCEFPVMSPDFTVVHVRLLTV